jgi:hypothetical protein
MFRFAVVAILILCASGAANAAGPHGTQFGQPMDDSGNVLLTDEVAQALADTGAGWVRVNFRLGPYSSDTAEWYTKYDGIVNRLRSRGLEIIGLMTNEAWPGGVSDWQANAYETTGGNGYNAYLENWCNFFKRAAAHWKDQIKYWELWNEPDCLATIYPSNYGALLANAYDKVHTDGTDVKIISGGLCTGETDPDDGDGFLDATYNVSINNTHWFSNMHTKWGTYPLDHIGYHIYIDQWGSLNTTKMSNLLDGIRNTYVAYEGSNTPKKVWITEVGWQYNPNAPPYFCTEAEQAANLTACINTANSKSYVRHVNWFFLQDVPSAQLWYGVFKSTGLGESDKKAAWTNMKNAFTYEGKWSNGITEQPILDYFNTKGHAAMGNPYDNGGTAWVHNWDFGPVQDFSGGTLGRMNVVNTADGIGCAVRGEILNKLFADHAILEFPLADQFFTGVGYKQYFECGHIAWTPSGGAVTTLYPHKIVVDNSDPGFSVVGSWSTIGASDAYNGSYRRRAGTGNSNTYPATWQITVPTSGYYDVYARWPQNATGMTSAKFDVVHKNGTSQVIVNQTANARRHGRWNRLGRWEFNAGTASVILRSEGSPSMYLLADAVRMVGPVEGPDTTPPTTPVVTDEGAFTTRTDRLSASWHSEDLESGIDHYEYAIGTSPTDPGSDYLVPWTSTGTENSVTKYVSLTNGQTYYFYVKSFGVSGRVSLGVSDGIKVDSTNPTTPVVTDDGNYTGLTNVLHCSWSSSDPESGIDHYEYGIGTALWATDVKPMTNCGLATEVWEPITLIPGKYYYFKVRSYNGAGTASFYGASNGITYQASVETPAIATTIDNVDGTKVLIRDGVISAIFGDRFYVNDFLRGIAIQETATRPLGARVHVTGTLSTVNGERVLTLGSVTPVQP